METTAPRMNSLTLRFPPDWERAFYDQYYERSRLSVRIALLVSLLFTGFWTASAATLQPDRFANWFLAIAVPASCAVALGLSFMPSFKTLMRPLLSTWVVLLVWMMTLNAILTRDLAETPVVLAATLVTGMIFAANFLRLGFVYAVPTVLSVTVLSLAVALSYGLFREPLAIFPITTGAVLTLLSAYFTERYVRSEFIASRLLDAERGRSERLLLSILPEPIVVRLKADEGTIADRYSEATILFADIVGFTAIASKLSPDQLVELLNDIFSEFDRITARHGLEMIKTIGDAYMVVGGVPIPRSDHAEAAAEMALEILDVVSGRTTPTGDPLQIRVGINTGPVIAGVIGTAKFAYDLWGDTVNVASRMESQGAPGAIRVTQTTYERLSGKYIFDNCGPVQVKGKGSIPVYGLVGRAGQC